jgi:N-acetylglucosaminyldiphosphoundecaprenol N-acetyl-beta-D-mannosaminyltransferase
MKYSILDIAIDDISLVEATDQVIAWARSDDQHQVVTLNPEFVVAAQKDAYFKNVIEKASLVTCDGMGLSWASWLLHRHRLRRAVGVEIVKSLLQSTDHNLKLFLLGGEVGAVEKVRHRYPDARVVGETAAGKLDTTTWRLEDNEQVIEMINASGANVLLVGFGQVKQEMWIDTHWKKIPNIRVAIGVGGTFDYLSGNVKRAPLVMRRLGLEWLFRLLRQPQRLPRIFNATVRFPWLVIKEKLNKNKSS